VSPSTASAVARVPSAPAGAASSARNRTAEAAMDAGWQAARTMVLNLDRP
jgi:hypothetical protein